MYFSLLMHLFLIVYVSRKCNTGLAFCGWKCGVDAGREKGGGQNRWRHWYPHSSLRRCVLFVFKGIRSCFWSILSGSGIFIHVCVI